MYKTRTNVFINWCKSHELDGSNPTIAYIATFFMCLFETKKLQASSIMGYRSALADYYPKDLSIRSSEVLNKLISSFFRDRPWIERSLVPWDLSIVLTSLAKPPFEPLAKVPIKYLTFKTVFLVVFATSRRRSEIHALSRKRTKISPVTGAITTAPALSFLAKNQRANAVERMKDIDIPSLSRLVGSDLPNDALNCPVRALSIYMERTDGYRGDRDRLFLSQVTSCQKDIAPGTISSWLKSTIAECYTLAKQRRDSEIPIRGHQVRALSASWAAKGNVSMSQLMNACFWKSQNTFTSHYLRDVWIDKDGECSIGPVVAAQQIVHPRDIELLSYLFC